MLAPVYDQNVLAKYREECAVYLHGHSVGGTNPSLVEMLFYDCQILAFDCAFNRCTAGDRADYFTTAEDLSKRINEALSRNNASPMSCSNSKFTALHISQQYIKAASGSRDSL